MYKFNEIEREYRSGDNGPKYLMKGPRASFGVVIIKAGDDFANHLHNIMEENFYILEGELEFYIDGQKLIASVGDYIHVEPNEAHYIRNMGTCDAKAVFCLAPYHDSDKIPLENPQV